MDELTIKWLTHILSMCGDVATRFPALTHTYLECIDRHNHQLDLVNVNQNSRHWHWLSVCICVVYLYLYVCMHACVPMCMRLGQKSTHFVTSVVRNKTSQLCSIKNPFIKFNFPRYYAISHNLYIYLSGEAGRKENLCTYKFAHTHTQSIIIRKILY